MTSSYAPHSQTSSRGPRQGIHCGQPEGTQPTKQPGQCIGEAQLVNCEEASHNQVLEKILIKRVKVD
jgi:hypothetical protein